MTASHRDQIHAAVVAELAAKFEARGLATEEIDGSFDLFGTGLVDSIAFVDLLVAIETRLALEFQFELLDFDRLESLDALVAELDRVRAGVDQGAQGSR